jgi:iron complex outermembrane receptor protein
MARLGEHHRAWAAVSRAVRTPSRLERDLSLTVSLAPGTPVFARVLGDPGFGPEKVTAYEAGWRVETGRVLLDFATFFNGYGELTSLEPQDPVAESGGVPRVVVPYRFGNGLDGRTWGAEAEVDFAARKGLSLHASYSFLRMDLAPGPGSVDTTSEAAELASPHHQGLLRASVDLGRTVTLDGTLRGVARLEGPGVPGYVTADLRTAWRVTDRLELALVGRDLLQDHHLEFVGTPDAPVEISRSAFVEALVRW